MEADLAEVHGLDLLVSKVIIRGIASAQAGHLRMGFVFLFCEGLRRGHVGSSEKLNLYPNKYQKMFLPLVQSMCPIAVAVVWKVAMCRWGMTNKNSMPCISQRDLWAFRLENGCDVLAQIILYQHERHESPESPSNETRGHGRRLSYGSPRLT